VPVATTPSGAPPAPQTRLAGAGARSFREDAVRRRADQARTDDCSVSPRHADRAGKDVFLGAHCQSSRHSPGRPGGVRVMHLPGGAFRRLPTIPFVGSQAHCPRNENPGRP
jgi:hypothetical protein